MGPLPPSPPAAPDLADARWAEIPWTDIETKGFVVIPSLLTAGECADSVAQYRLVAVDEGMRGNHNYGSPTLPPEASERFYPRLRAIMALVAERTASSVDTFRTTQLYSTDHWTEYAWHNDHDPHFFSQDPVHYLNFWIPVLKADRRRTGLLVAPLDALLAQSPELARWLIGHGAIMVKPTKRGTLFSDSDRLQQKLVAGPHPLERIAVSPDVGPGDAILMRGDLLHKTQDLETERLAVSFRVSSSRSIISRARLAQMGSHKFNYLATNRLRYAVRFAAFEVTAKEEMTAGELDAVSAVIHDRLSALQLRGARLTHEQFRNVVVEYAAELAEAQYD